MTKLTTVLANEDSSVQETRIGAVKASTEGTHLSAVPSLSAPNNDYFIERDGLCYAGTHLLIDMWGASGLDNEDLIREALLESIREAGATLLHIHLHRFQDNGGISGVAVLAESHISIHTWPERDFVALDVFMCGDSRPHRAIPVLKRYFRPTTVQLGEQRRGLTE